MKPATPALINYLDNNDDVVMADLYTFATVGGATLRYVDYPLPQIVIPAANFSGSPLNYASSGNVVFPRGPRFDRTKVSTKVGVEPAELSIKVFPAATDLIGDLTWQEFEVVGGFDGATVELDRFFMPIGADGIKGELSTSLGTIVWFYGRVADVDIERSVVNIKAKALINLLQQQQMPRRLFQSGCSHVFGDTMCGYNRTLGENALGAPTGVGAISVTAQAGSTQWDITVVSGPSVNYILGTMTGTSGQNNGISRGIKSISGAVIQVSREFPFAVNPGDTFNVLPGCDHTSTTCSAVFNNILRFGGFPYIPPPEISV